MIVSNLGINFEIWRVGVVTERSGNRADGQDHPTPPATGPLPSAVAVRDFGLGLPPDERPTARFEAEPQLLMLRSLYFHPSGQIPAYEWNFSDVNPPVHAWACWRVYKISGREATRDLPFLERCFQKLLLNFTWWVNRKDAEGRNVFQGGFIGLDNIGVFDRSAPLPTGGHLEQ